jgi:hypothetical protein
MYVTNINYGFEIRLLTISRRHVNTLVQKVPIESVARPKDTLNKHKLQKFKIREQDR